MKYPKPFEPTPSELKAAAQSLAKHISPNFVLCDPATDEILARGERRSNEQIAPEIPPENDAA